MIRLFVMKDLQLVHQMTVSENRWIYLYILNTCVTAICYNFWSNKPDRIHGIYIGVTHVKLLTLCDQGLIGAQCEPS